MTTPDPRIIALLDPRPTAGDREHARLYVNQLGREEESWIDECVAFSIIHRTAAARQAFHAALRIVNDYDGNAAERLCFALQANDAALAARQAKNGGCCDAPPPD